MEKHMNEYSHLKEDQLKEIIKDAIKDVLADPEHHCRYRIEASDHDRQHTELAALLVTMNKINEIKWGLGKTVLSYIIIGIIVVFGYGVLAWIAKSLGLAVPAIHFPSVSG